MKTEMVKLLAEQLGIDLHQQDVQRLTPLGVANQDNNPSIADILRQYGATH